LLSRAADRLSRHVDHARLGEYDQGVNLIGEGGFASIGN
jgi:hypothetical protein